MGVMEFYCKFYPDIYSQADTRFLAKHHKPQVRQTLYPPDKTPCDFFAFPQIKNSVEGKCL
jgi:hypothetical protein